MRTTCSREIFTKKCRQQPIFDSELKGAWHYNYVTFTPIAKNFIFYCRLIYMLSILCVRLTIKVKVGIPERFKVGWYSPQKTGSSHLNLGPLYQLILFFHPQTLIEMQRNTYPSAHDGPFPAHDPETSVPVSLYPAGKVFCCVLHVRDFWN